MNSLAPACGAEPETADSALRALGAMRSLRVPCLVVAHVSKAQAEQSGKTRPFGSVFVWNLARSCWELKRADIDAPGELLLGLFNVKRNEGARRAPFGVRFIFDPPDDAARSVTLEVCPLSAAEDLVQKLTLGNRILNVLTPGPLTVEEVADMLSASVETVGKTLRRLREHGRVVKLEDGVGRGQKARWGLAV